MFVLQMFRVPASEQSDDLTQRHTWVQSCPLRCSLWTQALPGTGQHTHIDTHVHARMWLTYCMKVIQSNFFICWLYVISIPVVFVSEIFKIHCTFSTLHKLTIILKYIGKCENEMNPDISPFSTHIPRKLFGIKPRCG